MTSSDSTSAVPIETAKKTPKKPASSSGSGYLSAAAAENPESRQAQGESRFYTVRSGDTLSKIAREFYGDANAYMRIFEANRPMLKDPDLIYPGQALRIPN